MRIFSKFLILQTLKIQSLTSLYINSSWYERESWELYGILYHYHKDLRRLLTDYSFKSFPFRKDFPLSGFVELRYCYISKRIVTSSIKLVQGYRSFKVISPWKYFV